MLLFGVGDVSGCLILHTSWADMNCDVLPI